MKQEAYTDLVRSNVQVLLENVTLAMETLEDDNQRLVEQVFKLEKDNTRLVTEIRMMKEENNHLKGEVIRLLDTIAKHKQDVEDECVGCEFGKRECAANCDPDAPCCQEKAMESDTNETH